MKFFTKLISMIFILTLCATFFVSCKPSGEVCFCEGTNKDNKPIKKGEIFEEGWITLFAKFSKPFNADTLKVKLYDLEDGDVLPEDTQTIKVKASDKSFRTDFFLINESTYKAVVELPNGNKLGEGKVKIIESF